MATSKPTAQELDHRIAFDAQTETDDGYGNVQGGFAERFRRWAAFRHRGGSESVIAARLEGRNILGIYVRADTLTRAITSDWRVRDIASGEVYAINIVDAVTDRQWVFIQAQSGVAA